MPITRPTLTNIQSTTTQFDDTVIVLNATKNVLKGTGARPEQGIIFTRPSSNNVAIIWNDAEQAFKLISTTDADSIAGNVTVTGNAALTVGNLSVLGSIVGNLVLSTAPTLGSHVANKSYVDAQAASGVQAGTGLTLTGNTLSVNVAQPTITSVGTLSSLTVTGNIGAANFSGNTSGTNTGDQTITLTGDVTGTGSGSFAATLSNTAVSPGFYTSANVTVDSKGRITTIANGAATSSGGATGGGTDKLFYENDVVVSQIYTIGSGAYTSGVTITQASPAVFTLASHGFVAGSQVIFSTTGALLTGLTVATPYYVISAGLTSGAFEVSATLGGSAINTSGTQSGVHSVAKVKNASSTGPITIADGVVVTINSGSVWSIV